MRKILLAGLFLTICAGICRSQESPFRFSSVFTYLFYFQPDSTNPQSRKAEAMYLLRGDEGSVFMSLNTFRRDSVLAIPNVGVEMMAFLKTLSSDFAFRVIKDNKMSKIVYEDEINRELYNYTEPANAFNWTISPDTSTINYFPCQKATLEYGNRRWTAWFSNTIPINDGPYKFNGLPGLIVKITDSDGYFRFELTGINEKNGEVAARKNSPRHSTRKEFFNAAAYYKQNQYDMFTQRVTIVSGGEAIKKNIEERNRKNNNSIERL